MDKATFDKGREIRSAVLGKEFVDAYVKLKTQSWNEYMGRLTKWELETTLDC